MLEYSLNYVSINKAPGDSIPAEVIYIGSFA